MLISCDYTYLLFQLPRSNIFYFGLIKHRNLLMRECGLQDMQVIHSLHTAVTALFV